MDYQRRENHRVIAIDPTSRGFGFAVLEGAARLIDWGTRDTGHADSELALRQMKALVKFYVPDAMVEEDTEDRSSRRRTRVRSLIEALSEGADRRGSPVERISRRQVLEVFGNAGANTKYRVAQVIAEHFPELTPHVPPRRKPWMSEDTRMSIFDAVAFALVHYYRCTETSPVLESTRTPRAAFPQPGV